MAEGVKEQVGDLVSAGKRRFGLEKPSAADDDGRVGIVRGALRTFADGDHDGFIDALRDDVFWEAPGSGSFPGGGEHEGSDAVRKEYIENAGRTFTSFGFRPESFVDADDADAVIVIGRFEGEGVEGDKLDEPGVQVWEFQGNEVARVRIFTDGAAFPEVVTERKQREWEEEERAKEEKESEDDGGDKAKAEASTEKKDDGEKAKAEASSAEKKDDAAQREDESG
jgi:ketosteroid isomerase-like protein